MRKHQKENPAGGRGFKGGRGVIQQPQANLEAFSQNCQENYGSINLLADLLDRHLALRTENALLRAENARLMGLIAGGCV